MYPVRPLPKAIIERTKTCIVHKRCTDEIIIFKYTESRAPVCLVQLHKVFRRT